MKFVKKGQQGRTRGSGLFCLSACRLDKQIILLILLLFFDALAALLCRALHGQHLFFLTVTAAACLPDTAAVSPHASIVPLAAAVAVPLVTVPTVTVPLVTAPMVTVPRVTAAR